MSLSQQDKKQIKSIKDDTKDDNSFINKVQEYLKTRYPSDSTRSVKLSLYKKYIETSGLLLDANNSKLIVDPQLRINLSREREQKALRLKTDITKNVIKKLTAMKDSSNLYELIMFQLLNTGRRFTEYLKGDWKVEDEKKNMVSTDFISKKRRQANERYDIKVLNAKGFMERHNKILQLIGDRNFENVRRSTIRFITVNKSLRPIKNASELRPLYLHILSKQDQFRRMNRVQLAKDVLLHENKSVSPYYVDRFTTVELKDMNRKDLLQFLTNNDIKGYSKKKKAVILQAAKDFIQNNSL
jgi:hypothetical protein